MHPTPHPAIVPTPTQQAAIAKVVAAISRAGGVALLCGPAGVGKSTVIDEVVVGERMRGRSIEVRDLGGWLDAAAPWPGNLPDVLVADAAHLARDGDLARLLAACRLRASPAALVLVGEGRLFTLVSRDPAIERAIHLRATLRPLSRQESGLVIEPALVAARVQPRPADAVVDVIHEIGGGIPAAMLRLAELAVVVAASRSDRSLTTRDIEAIHRRLSPLAA